jgi:hypothetical protein
MIRATGRDKNEVSGDSGLSIPDGSLGHENDDIFECQEQAYIAHGLFLPLRFALRNCQAKFNYSHADVTTMVSVKKRKKIRYVTQNKSNLPASTM